MPTGHDLDALDERAPRDRLRVLVAANRTDAGRLTGDLRASRHEVQVCGDLQQAVARARSWPPDVALLDVDLPDSQGVETLSAWVRDLPGVPAVMLVPLHDEELFARIAAAGAGDFLVKGHYDAEVLERVLRYAVERHKRAAHTSRLLEELRLRTGALEAAANAIVITDRQGRIVWANPALCGSTGYAMEEVLGATPRLFKSGHHPRSFYEELWRTILEGRTWNGEIRNRRKDGREYVERNTITPVRDTAGAISHFIAVKEDVTELRSLEEQVRATQRLESVGRVVGGVAHDVNNVLTTITGYAGLMLQRLDRDDPRRRYAREIEAAATSAADLMRHLLAFSRQQKIEPQVVDLGELVGTSAPFLQRLIGEDVLLHLEIASRPLAVRADPAQLNQVVMNLAVNARDAMPSGGQLTIEVALAELDEEFARRHPPVRPGPHVLLSFSDSGVGMDKEVQARIFEPFFTTKAEGGTGLGLSTVYGIVRQSGGAIWFYSEPGRGATFKIYLPRVAEAPEQSFAPPREERLESGGGETVLLVEDEEALREMAVEVLRETGYQVLSAPTGSRALELARGHAGPIHLLVTDLVMPGLGGRELAERLLEDRPATPVLFVSGYSEHAVVQGGGLEVGARFLGKPYTPFGLLRKVREILGDTPQPATPGAE